MTDSAQEQTTAEILKKENEDAEELMRTKCPNMISAVNSNLHLLTLMVPIAMNRMREKETETFYRIKFELEKLYKTIGSFEKDITQFLSKIDSMDKENKKAV